jgi:hypothetical protein
MALSANARLNISKVSKNVFPNLKKKIHTNNVAHENHPFIIAEKFAQQARHAFTLNRYSTMSKQTIMIQFMAFA